MTSKSSSTKWQCREHAFSLGSKPLIMGILNVTPDSFSDGGKHNNQEAALTCARAMLDDGADIIDVGGESTRPGAPEVSTKEELKRVIPVIKALAADSGAVISIDTTKSEVALRATEAGAHIINDVSALTADPEMPNVALESGAGVVLMHMLGNPRNMQHNPQYDDVVATVSKHLTDRVIELTSKGLPKDTLAIDPGIGFGKTVEHNLQLIAGLDRIKSLGLPVVVGLSRKSFLGKLTGNEVENRLAGSLAGLVFAVLNGADIMRVHDVKESRDALIIATKLKNA